MEVWVEQQGGADSGPQCPGDSGSSARTLFSSCLPSERCPPIHTSIRVWARQFSPDCVPWQRITPIPSSCVLSGHTGGTQRPTYNSRDKTQVSNPHTTRDFPPWNMNAAEKWVSLNKWAYILLKPQNFILSHIHFPHKSQHFFVVKNTMNWARVIDSTVSKAFAFMWPTQIWSPIDIPYGPLYITLEDLWESF